MRVKPHARRLLLHTIRIPRRGFLASVGRSLMTIIPVAIGNDELTAKKRKKRKKPRGRKRRKQPPNPKTTPDAACSASGTDASLDVRRVAQTFRALRSGQLTKASVVLRGNPDGADFDLEIWDVDVRGMPTTVLASTTVSNVPATSPGGPSRSLIGDFAAPTTVERSSRYALVVNESWMSQVGFRFVLQGNAIDGCPDGNLFSESEASGAFTPVSDLDLVFATFVTA